jgi:hypothetical protein
LGSGVAGGGAFSLAEVVLFLFNDILDSLKV